MLKQAAVLFAHHVALGHNGLVEDVDDARDLVQNLFEPQLVRLKGRHNKNMSALRRQHECTFLKMPPLCLVNDDEEHLLVRRLAVGADVAERRLRRKQLARNRHAKAKQTKKLLFVASCNMYVNPHLVQA